MTPEEIDRLDSFALLGPGFTRAGLSLLSPLVPAGGNGRIAYLEYEQTTNELVTFDGPEKEVDLVLEGPTEPLHVALDAFGHGEAVGAIREKIAAGDVYQVNLTLRARVSGASPTDVLQTLFRRGVPRFGAWVRLPSGTEFISSSPELFFEVEGRRIRCEPMKGTARPADTELLQASEKDSAELAMITDLIRNDLTPLCEPRSVHVISERRFVHLPYAVQTVSDVSGTLQPRIGIQQILKNLHPGGSITGAPKRAACELISQLETTPRRAYCGTLGFRCGDRHTFSLLIRTAQRDGDDWVYGVGGGIVWDSVAEKELDEIHVKLGALR